MEKNKVNGIDSAIYAFITIEDQQNTPIFLSLNLAVV